MIVGFVAVLLVLAWGHCPPREPRGAVGPDPDEVYDLWARYPEAKA